MEITTSPHRPASTPWGRLVALVVVLAPVTVLVLLPIGLGLQRYVVTGHSMAGDGPGSISRGSVVFERSVPVSDLRPGDVITYRPPASAETDGLVTHRIVDIGPHGIRTQGDARSEPDPWLLEPDGPVVPRVVFALPYVGYAYLVLGGPLQWVLVAAGVGLLMLAVSRAARRTKPALTSAPPDRIRAGAGAEQ
ncbi:S24/S26 family peptidase [Nocardioides pyridinolyticus]